MLRAQGDRLRGHSAESNGGSRSAGGTSLAVGPLSDASGKWQRFEKTTTHKDTPTRHGRRGFTRTKSRGRINGGSKTVYHTGIHDRRSNAASLTAASLTVFVFWFLRPPGPCRGVHRAGGSGAGVGRPQGFSCTDTGHPYTPTSADPLGPCPRRVRSPRPPTPSPPAHTGRSAKPGGVSSADSPTSPPVRRHTPAATAFGTAVLSKPHHRPESA